jgi:hypothetical protein
MASGEIDFDGALAWPIGSIDEGFRVVVGEVLNTSRWLNAVGSTGIMRRAYLEASSFARHRQAFGSRVASFPLVRAQLAEMKAEGSAALSSTMALASMVASLDEGNADDTLASAYRLLVNANKYVTSIGGTDVARRGIEVLGGNGTIEDFSPLPRLYRDAMVFESWEGTHNVLSAQVLRDCARLGILEPTLAWVRAELDVSADLPDTHTVTHALDALEPRLRRSIADPASGAANFRGQLENLMRIVQAACLLSEATLEGSASPKSATTALFVRRHLSPSPFPEEEGEWGALVEAVLAGDAD